MCISNEISTVLRKVLSFIFHYETLDSSDGQIVELLAHMLLPFAKPFDATELTPVDSMANFRS